MSQGLLEFQETFPESSDQRGETFYFMGTAYRFLGMACPLFDYANYLDCRGNRILPRRIDKWDSVTIDRLRRLAKINKNSWDGRRLVPTKNSDIESGSAYSFEIVESGIKVCITPSEIVLKLFQQRKQKAEEQLCLLWEKTGVNEFPTPKLTGEQEVDEPIGMLVS